MYFQHVGSLGNLDLVRSVHDLGIKLGLGDPTVRNTLTDMYA